MPTFYEDLQLIEAAQQAGATHLFIAQDYTTPDRFYPVHVYPGTDPITITRSHRDPLVSCYSLNDPGLPIMKQLLERRPWHPEPVTAATEPTPAPRIAGYRTLNDAVLEHLPVPDPATRRVDRPAPAQTAVDPDTSVSLELLAHSAGQPPSHAVRQPRTVTIPDLRAARHNLDLAREWTLSAASTRRDYDHYNDARAQLLVTTQAAYAQARIAPDTIRQATGLSAQDAQPLHTQAGLEEGAAARPPAPIATDSIGY
jgi:hypothetical protein